MCKHLIGPTIFGEARLLMLPNSKAHVLAIFVRLAKYINHSEFMGRSGADEDMLELGRSIRQIIFEHNLIVIIKGDNSV